MTLPQTMSAQRELAEWRRRTLPLMGGLLMVLTAVFVGIAVWQMQQLRGMLEDRSENAAEAAFVALDQAAKEGRVVLPADYVTLRAVSALESEAIRRRYRHADVVVASRGWTRAMGFVTGMLMALLGTALALGRLAESETTLSGEAGSAKVALASSSPGLVLASLGTILMIVVIVVRSDTGVRDVPVYAGMLRGAAVAAPASVADSTFDSVLDGVAAERAPADSAPRARAAAPAGAP